MKVGTIVVTYNRLQLLKEVIESLRQQTYQDNHIIVINNGSTDETLSWLSQQKDIITITQENLGGAGGFYTGMKYVAEHEYEYCWIMDDDVICKPTALEELVKAYQVRDNIGFVCSRVIGVNGNPMNTPSPDINKTNNGYADLYDLVANHAMVKVSIATFVSVFLSTKRIQEIGLPIKEYFIWGDDSEYTERISSLYPSYIACHSIVTHKRLIQKKLTFQEETDSQRLKNYFFMFRNQAYTRLLNKHKKGFVKIASIHLLEAIRLLLQGKIRQSGIIFKAYLSLFSFNPQIQYPDKV